MSKVWEKHPAYIHLNGYELKSNLWHLTKRDFMSGDTMILLFWLVFFFLVSVLVACIMYIKGMFRPKHEKYAPIRSRYKPMTPEQQEEQAEIDDLCAETEERLLKAYAPMEAAPIEEAKPDKKAFSERFSLKRSDPTSSATPNLKRTHKKRQYKPEYNTPEPSHALDDVIKALIALGYSTKDSTQAAQQALAKHQGADTPSLVRHALQLF